MLVAKQFAPESFARSGKLSGNRRADSKVIKIVQAANDGLSAGVTKQGLLLEPTATIPLKFHEMPHLNIEEAGELTSPVVTPRRSPIQQNREIHKKTLPRVCHVGHCGIAGNHYPHAPHRALRPLRMFL